MFRTRPIRRSQLIAPFGVGSMVDFRNDEALMCAGIDSWFDASPPPELQVFEERLQARLHCDYFVLPPDFSEKEAGHQLRVPFVRFPRWHYCPRCFRMQEVTLFGDQPFCTGCGEGRRRRRMIPIRIVAACEAGHIEDFPFRRWVGCTCEDGGQLYFKSGRSAASIQGTKIECKGCGRVSSLANAFQQEALQARGAHCSGAQPWLGFERGEADCSHPLRTLLRGASNLYFPVVSSSIYIPARVAAADSRIHELIEDPARWTAMTASLVEGQPNEVILRTFALMWKVDPDQLILAVRTRLAAQEQQAPVADSEEAFRRQEFNVLRAGSPDHRADLYCVTRPGSDYPELSAFIETVGLVRKLRETRVLTSFTRINPPGAGTDAEQPLSRPPRPRWLPAAVVRGEGIFIELRNDVVAEWALSPRPRVGPFLANYERQRAARQFAPRGVDARFLMIHSLAHILIRELTFLCGYGSSALRERLYCNLEAGSSPMLGILIYTASGDSEGTLGGLVRQAEPDRLPFLFSSALRRTMWCSNDPVCIESPAQGAGISNLAACHGCALLPETSCEEGNRLLDRALLTGTPDNPELGFFPRFGFPLTG